MKNLNIFYIIASVTTLIGVFLKITHTPGGFLVLVGFVLGSIVLIIDNSRCKKRVKELENK